MKFKSEEEGITKKEMEFHFEDFDLNLEKVIKEMSTCDECLHGFKCEEHDFTK
jgi:hypothetical protein